MLRSGRRSPGGAADERLVHISACHDCGTTLVRNSVSSRPSHHLRAAVGVSLITAASPRALAIVADTPPPLGGLTAVEFRQRRE